MTKLPVPEQWTLAKLNDREVAEEIEKHINYVDQDGRSVHLPMEFVRHYTTRHDGVLATIVAIATLPIILADGGILGVERGFDRLRGISFIIPKQIMDLVPKTEEATPEAVAGAMKFLTDEWLVDVNTSYTGKCVVIASALTVIERSLLDSRPTFFVTAGRRGSGKGTTLIMLIKAITGIWPAAAAWSPSEEERRKSIMSYFLAGVPYILWDNISRGTQINCPHIERSCTAAYYTDRRLGVSETVATAASVIHFFTGNAIGPKGDLASRSLSIWLDADRPDPENRDFVHHDPIEWTNEHRAEILKALYTILLGNPTLKAKRNARMKTRFKMWWRLVGSAVENAAKEAAKDAGDAAELAKMKVDFAELFKGQDSDDEDDTSLSGVLDLMRKKWVGGNNKFSASDLTPVVNSTDIDNLLRDAFREFFFPTLPDHQKVTAIMIGKKLKTRVGEPVLWGDETLVLRSEKPPGGGGNATAVYWVEVTKNNVDRSQQATKREVGEVGGEQNEPPM